MTIGVSDRLEMSGSSEWCGAGEMFGDECGDDSGVFWDDLSPDEAWTSESPKSLELSITGWAEALELDRDIED
jgi:hypothetical protein